MAVPGEPAYIARPAVHGQSLLWRFDLKIAGPWDRT